MANNKMTDDLKNNTEPATKHDVTEGGVMGAVGGAVVGAIAAGPLAPLGAVVGAVAGGAASAAAVNVVDKHDNDYDGTSNTRSMATMDGDGSYAATAPATMGYSTATMGVDGETVIPIVEEELAVGKRQVQGGGAHVRTGVIETPVEQSVTLREEHITVDRHPVNRAATDADLASLGERTIELTETDEMAVVSKQARVVEEVVVGKTATEHTETIHDTVRRTDVEIEQIDGTDMRGTSR